MNRLRAGLVVTPIGAIIGSAAGAWMFSIFMPNLGSASEVFVIGVVVGIFLALPTTCVVLPLAESGSQLLAAIIGMTSGLVTGAITFLFPLAVAGALGGLCSGLSYGWVLRKVERWNADDIVMS